MKYKKVLYVLLLVGIIGIFSFTNVFAENAHRDNIDVMLENPAYFSSILAYELPSKELLDQILEDPKLVFIVTRDPSILKIALEPVRSDFSNQDTSSAIISEDSLLFIDEELAFLAQEEPLSIGSVDKVAVIEESGTTERMQAIEMALNEQEVNIEINQDREVTEKVAIDDQSIDESTGIENSFVVKEKVIKTDLVIEENLDISQKSEEEVVQEIKENIVEVTEEVAEEDQVQQEQQVIVLPESGNVEKEVTQETTDQIVMFNAIPRQNFVPELEQQQTNTSRSLSTSLVSSRDGQPVDLKGPLSIELTLRYNREERTMVLVGQRIVNVPPPKYRDPTIGPNQFVLQCEDSNGEVLGGYPLSNPSQMRVEWVNPENVKAPTLLEGEHFKIPESEFFMVVPFFEDLRSVKLLRPYPQSQEITRSINLHRAPQQAEDLMETVGSAVINHEAISAFIEGRNIELMR